MESNLITSLPRGPREQSPAAPIHPSTGAPSGAGFEDAGRSSSARGGVRNGAKPWQLAEEVWDSLEPAGFYARVLRGPLLMGTTLVILPFVFPVALAVFVVNAVLHRGIARAFFLQDRVGQRGRVFRVVKFRTMRDGGGDDGARVTRFGRFLRNGHLDELPQILNVLRGEMSLIGPRPEMTSIEAWAVDEVPGFHRRLVLRPGITGLAQITQGYARAGNAAAYREKKARNESYLASMGLGADLSILFRTGLWMLRRRGWRWCDQARAASAPVKSVRYASTIVSKE